MLKKSHGGLYKAPEMEEIKRLKTRGDKIKFIDLRFERVQLFAGIYTSLPKQ